MNEETAVQPIWPASGGIVHFVEEDGSFSMAVVGHVKTNGDYPIVHLGVYEEDWTVTRWYYSKFDPDDDRPGTWHNITRPNE